LASTRPAQDAWAARAETALKSTQQQCDALRARVEVVHIYAHERPSRAELTAACQAAVEPLQRQLESMSAQLAHQQQQSAIREAAAATVAATAAAAAAAHSSSAGMDSPAARVSKMEMDAHDRALQQCRDAAAKATQQIEARVDEALQEIRRSQRECVSQCQEQLDTAAARGRGSPSQHRYGDQSPPRSPHDETAQAQLRQRCQMAHDLASQASSKASETAGQLSQLNADMREQDRFVRDLQQQLQQNQAAPPTTPASASEAGQARRAIEELREVLSSAEESLRTELIMEREARCVRRTRPNTNIPPPTAPSLTSITTHVAGLRRKAGLRTS
jgi:DNA repair exonuclease SbcCD ATPase subunit